MPLVAISSESLKIRPEAKVIVKGYDGSSQHGLRVAGVL